MPPGGRATTDALGNVTHGDVILDDCAGSLFHAESRLLTAVGLRDHVVVFDAPNNETHTAATLAVVKAKFPNKPVKARLTPSPSWRSMLNMHW